MDSINKTIATVATTLEQLKSKDADDAQVGYEAVSATQNVNFTAAVGEGPLNPSPGDTCQITATWTYPQVKGQGVSAAKFNKDMVQLVADTLDASKRASMDDEDSRVTMMYILPRSPRLTAISPACEPTPTAINLRIDRSE